MDDEKNQENPWDRHCFIVKNEKEFYSCIEKKLRDNGFEVVETIPKLGWGSYLAAHAA